MKYEELQSLLRDPLNPFLVAQWHGLLCGLLATGRPITVVLWHRMASQYSDDGILLDSELSDALEQYIEQQKKQFDDERISFDIVLLDDEHPLDQRAQALGHWCSAYLFGLAVGGVTQETEMGVDSKELLRDMSEISRVEFDQDESDIEDELQYNEILEYIRVGVLLLNTELNSLPFSQTQEH